MDIATEDPITKRRWDLRSPVQQMEVVRMIRRDLPILLVLSPPCTVFSQLQVLSSAHWSAQKDRQYEESLILLRFAVRLCKLQIDLGNVFILEHPRSATSWSIVDVLGLTEREDVLLADFHMCAYGMMSEDSDGPAPVYKPTRIATNSTVAAELIPALCHGGHRHVHLLNGRAKAAHKYPQALVDRILEAVAVESSYRNSSLSHDSLMSVESEELHEQEPFRALPEVEIPREMDELIQASRREELQIFGEMNVYDHVHESSIARGARIVGTRWVTVNKGTRDRPRIRSRLVAKEFADTKTDELFAPTPP